MREAGVYGNILLRRGNNHLFTCLNNTDMPINIRLVGFNSIEAENFVAILDLAEFGLENAWEVENLASANFYLVKDSKDAGLNNQFPESRCLFYQSLNEKSKPKAIFYDESYVPLLHRLIYVLNTLSEDATLNESDQIPDENEDNQYLPSKTLLNLSAAKDPGVIRFADSREIYIFPEKGVFYYKDRLESIKKDLLIQDSTLFDSISSDELEASVNALKLTEKPLGHLIWYMAFIASNGHLMAGLSEQDTISLSSWPYLGLESRSYIKLATYLKNNTGTLSQAAEESNIDRSIAINFYNASKLAGLIKPLPAVVDSKTTEKFTEKLGLLNKIKKRLRS